MNSKEVIKRLIEEGWINVGGKGDHIKFKHPDKQVHVVVPHPRKDVALGTLRTIYRQAGWGGNNVIFGLCAFGGMTNTRMA
jgi:predicted RNA binding protein YcfA (HicA-like mRNA interferase family)